MPTRPITRFTFDDHTIGTFEPIALLVPGLHADALTDPWIPNNQQLRLRIFAPLGWDGYTFEVVGTLEPPLDSPDWRPIFVFDFRVEDSNNYEMHLFLWRRRVYREAAPDVYLEGRWHPKMGETTALVLPPTVKFNTAYESMATAPELLQRLVRHHSEFDE